MGIQRQVKNCAKLSKKKNSIVIVAVDLEEYRTLSGMTSLQTFFNAMVWTSYAVRIKLLKMAMNSRPIDSWLQSFRRRTTAENSTMLVQ